MTVLDGDGAEVASATLVDSLAALASTPGFRTVSVGAGTVEVHASATDFARAGARARAVAASEKRLIDETILALEARAAVAARPGVGEALDLLRGEVGAGGLFQQSLAQSVSQSLARPSQQSGGGLFRDSLARASDAPDLRTPEGGASPRGGVPAARWSGGASPGAA